MREQRGIQQGVVLLGLRGPFFNAGTRGVVKSSCQVPWLQSVAKNHGHPDLGLLVYESNRVSRRLDYSWCECDWMVSDRHHHFWTGVMRCALTMQTYITAPKAHAHTSRTQKLIIVRDISTNTKGQARKMHAEIDTTTRSLHEICSGTKEWKKSNGYQRWAFNHSHHW